MLCLAMSKLKKIFVKLDMYRCMLLVYDYLTWTLFDRQGTKMVCPCFIDCHSLFFPLFHGMLPFLLTQKKEQGREVGVLPSWIFCLLVAMQQLHYISSIVNKKISPIYMLFLYI